MKSIIFTILLIFTVLLTSCSHIEDTNGPEDYSIVSFTDEDILSGKNSVFVVGSTKSQSKNNNKLVGTYKASKISGIEKIAEYRSDRENISFTIKLTCESGNALVVIVSNNEIIKKIPSNDSMTIDVINNKKNYKILLVAESAKISLEYQVES